MQPISTSYEHAVKIVIHGPTYYVGITPVNSGPAIPRILSCRLSKDIINEMASSLEFVIEDASRFANQFDPYNPIQHGSFVEMYINDISGGVMTDPLPVDGWHKKFSGYIIDPDLSAAAGSRALSVFATDRMWAVLHARARIHEGTPTESVNGRLKPIDDTRLIWQVIDEDNVDIIDLDDETMPILTRFVRTGTDSYQAPFPAGRLLTMKPNEYSVNYSLGRIVFKNPQKPTDYPADNYGYWVHCHRYHTELEPYILEDALHDFLVNVQDQGGVHLTYGVDFDFYDTDGDARSSAAEFAITAADPANNRFAIAGDQTASFPVGSRFSVKDSTGNDGNYTVNSSVYVPLPTDRTRIVPDEEVVSNVGDGTISLYATTGIYVSNIDWDEDRGIGQDYISMLRETGVMPYNYFLYCNENGKIIGQYILQEAAAERSISRELYAQFPSSLTDIFTRAVVLSNGNTYPTALINAGNSTLTYRGMCFGHGGVALPLGSGWQAAAQNSDTVPNGWIDHWQAFPGYPGDDPPDPDPVVWEDRLFDDSVLTYVGLAARGCFKYWKEDPEAYTDFFYPFPNVNVPPPTGQDTIIFFDLVLDDPQEIDKLMLRMYIPRCNVEDKEHVQALYEDGDSRGPWNADNLILDDQAPHVGEVLQQALLSVLYAREGESVWRGLGPNATVFTMDPTKCDTKILKIDKVHKIKKFRILFHRPFVATTEGGMRFALYMLNTFQCYNKGTIYLPGVDANDEKVLPFARITGTPDVSSLLGEDGLLAANPPDNETFTTPNGALTDSYTGCTICIPDAANGVFLAEVLYNDRDTPVLGTQTIKLKVIEGKDHTDLTIMGALATDKWYLMNNRYWLDLLYNRIDLYVLRLYNKMNAVHLVWKTQTIENNEITDLGTALRKATTVVNEAISNFTGIQVSLAYRPDYDVGMTVNEPILQTPRYFVVALDYIFESDQAVVNMKLIDFDAVLS